MTKITIFSGFLGAGKTTLIKKLIAELLVENMSQASGIGGFGYDPIVFIPELKKTVAELTDTEKNLISHRGKACRILMPLIQQFSSIQK